VNRFNPSIPADWRLIKIDERQHWHEKIAAQTTAIYGVYAYDAATHVHACEATPSYALWFVSNEADPIDSLSDEDREKLHEDVLCAHDEPCILMHVRDVERLCEQFPDRVRKVALDADDSDNADNADRRDLKVVDEIAEGWGTGALMF